MSKNVKKIVEIGEMNRNPKYNADLDSEEDLVFAESADIPPFVCIMSSKAHSGCFLCYAENQMDELERYRKSEPEKGYDMEFFFQSQNSEQLVKLIREHYKTTDGWIDATVDDIQSKLFECVKQLHYKREE